MSRVLGSAAAAADVVYWWIIHKVDAEVVGRVCGGDRWTCAQSSLNWECASSCAWKERESARAKRYEPTGSKRAHATRRRLGHARTLGIPCARDNGRRQVNVRRVVDRSVRRRRQRQRPTNVVDRARPTTTGQIMRKCQFPSNVHCLFSSGL